MTASSQKTKGQRIFHAYSLMSLGLEMGVAIFLGWALGNWLDQKFDTEPWLMLFFLLIGIAAGFRGMLRAARQANSAIEESNE